MNSLREAADDEPVWTWAADAQHVGFVRRRQAHEALIHRLDAELTAGRRTPLDPALAADGVGEALQYMFGGLPEWASIDAHGPAGRIATTDSADTWAIQMVTWSGTSPNTGTRYDHEGGLVEVAIDDPSFTITGTAGDLDAWMWSRPTIEPLRRDGDTSALERLVASGVQ